MASEARQWFSKIDEAAERYVPQVTHEMIVTGARKGILSVIIGTNPPCSRWWSSTSSSPTIISRSAAEFWKHVVDGTPPDQGAPMADYPRRPPSCASSAWKARTLGPRLLRTGWTTAEPRSLLTRRRKTSESTGRSLTFERLERARALRVVRDNKARSFSIKAEKK